MMIEIFRNFLNSERVYNYNEIEIVIDKILPYIEYSHTNKNYKYLNIPCSFDIETSSFYSGQSEKISIMYEWTFGVYGLVIVGRRWDEFIKVLDTVAKRLCLNIKKRLCVYVHNLSYEFQFFRKYFIWDKVFSIDNRKPIYALTINGIEFRCSYQLSGYSLAKIGDDLKLFKVKKLIGDLDYEKIRHSETPLTEKEIAYCVNDVKVVMAYITECIIQNGEISKIPLTKTGYVRNYCRNMCFYDDKPRKDSFKRLRYMDIMQGLKLTVDEYKQLKNAFQGGFTHANPFFTNKIINDVSSYDFTSSYPCVLIAEKFPMSSGEIMKINSVNEFEYNLKKYCCLFDVEFFNLQSRLWFDSYISVSRCKDVTTAVLNNGRIVSAKYLKTTITEQDYLIIKHFYTWDKIKISNFRRYKKDYLPTDFVKAILKLYADKTVLKGVEGKEVEYLKSKEMLNSCYGMAVTDIVRKEYRYTYDWLNPIEPIYDDVIKAYNNNRGRFLFYPWGVWVTAYARRNLFTGILEFRNDYIYSDTDSIKVINIDKHINYINNYNNMIKKRLLRSMDYHKIAYDAIEPETKDGIKKCLGVWDFDGHYSKFKTLGAKRYLVQYSSDSRNKIKDRGRINLTVSGLNKQICVPWLISVYGETGIFDYFSDDMYIPSEYTGKMTHTYIDDMKEGVVTDYTGKKTTFKEMSAVHLEKADYSLSIAREYIDYFLGVQEDDY